MDILTPLQDLLLRSWKIFLGAWFVWLPLLMLYALWNIRLYYLRAKFLHGQRWTFLEIKIPREIYKSPRAMEVFLNAIHNSYDGDFMDKYMRGFLRCWYSLEIASINGKIRFFICTQQFHRNWVEAQLYAQYPDVEITEVDDYTRELFPDEIGPDWRTYGMEFGLVNDDVYPIKTYIDYGLHELATKEEQKTDPITATIEHLGSLKEGEQLWIQILIMATKKKWEDEAQKLVEKLMKRDKAKEGESMNMGALMLSPGERQIVEAVERNVSKVGFDTGIRIFYLAHKEKFHIMNIFAMSSIWKQYAAVNLNGFKPVRTTSIDYPLIFGKQREARKKRIILDSFRKRSQFYMPYVYPSFVLNSEELATIFHFPGRVSETPSFGRIEAKKGEAPANLPL